MTLDMQKLWREVSEQEPREHGRCHVGAKAQTGRALSAFDALVASTG